MVSDKATQTQNEMNNVQMQYAAMPNQNNRTSAPSMNFPSWRDPTLHQNTSQAPAPKFFSFWRNPTTRCTMSQTHQTQHNLTQPPDEPQHNNLIQHFPSPPPTWSPNPQFLSPSPVEPLKPLMPRGHGPCNRCGTCMSRYFYQSKWEPDRECCYECWEPDREGRGDDTLEEWRGRYFLRGVGNAYVDGVMDVEGERTEETKVAREGWGLAALGPVEEWREEAARKAKLDTKEGTKISDDAEAEESGDEIVVESSPRQARDEVVGGTENVGAVISTEAVSPPPPSARFWDYKTEAKPERGFKETPVEILQTLTRSGKVTRRTN